MNNIEVHLSNYLRTTVRHPLSKKLGGQVDHRLYWGIDLLLSSHISIPLKDQLKTNIKL